MALANETSLSKNATQTIRAMCLTFEEHDHVQIIQGSEII